MHTQMNLDSELRTMLVAILQELAQSFTAVGGEPERQTAAPAIFEDTKVNGFIPTQWPRLEAGLEEEAAKLKSRDFTVGFVPGRDVYLYVAGSSGLGRLAKSLQLPLFKVGLSAQPDLLTRQAELRTDRYGDCIKADDTYAASGGFDDWEIRQCELRELPRNPVAASMPRALKLRLPTGMTPRQFEAQLNRTLAPISLHEWSRSPEAAAHFAALRLSPEIARRYTAYRFGSATRHSAAQEIYICRPRNDLAKIAALSMRIIREQVLTKSSVKAGAKSPAQASL